MCLQLAVTLATSTQRWGTGQHLATLSTSSSVVPFSTESALLLRVLERVRHRLRVPNISCGAVLIRIDDD